MKEENKDLPAQKQRLDEMRDELVSLDHAVLNDEAKTGDYKRSKTREAFSLKLGALLELSEKTGVVAEMGKLLVDLIPRGRTEPGRAREDYQGHEATEAVLQDAHRCIQDVVFNPSPMPAALSDGGFQHQRETSLESARHAAAHAGYGAEAEAHHNGTGSSYPAGYEDTSYRYSQHGVPLSPPVLPEIGAGGSRLPPGAGTGFHEDLDSVADLYNGHEGNGGPRLAAPVGGGYDHTNRSSLAYMDGPGSDDGVVRRDALHEDETEGERREREQAEDNAREAEEDHAAAAAATEGTNPWHYREGNTPEVDGAPQRNSVESVGREATSPSTSHAGAGIPYTAARNNQQLYVSPFARKHDMVQC